jgi:hypothetical protein
LLSRVETPDTRLGLPIPGAYFANKESQKAAIAVSKSGKGAGEKNKSTSQREKKAALKSPTFKRLPFAGCCLRMAGALIGPLESE